MSMPGKGSRIASSRDIVCLHTRITTKICALKVPTSKLHLTKLNSDSHAEAKRERLARQMGRDFCELLELHLNVVERSTFTGKDHSQRCHLAQRFWRNHHNKRTGSSFQSSKCRALITASMHFAC